MKLEKNAKYIKFDEVDENVTMDIIIQNTKEYIKF